MTVHLIKLCVGAGSLTDLADWQARRLADGQELMHVTRQTPKRGPELVPGGSLYWVINGWISVRQRLLELRPVEKDGVPHCALVLAVDLITVQPRPRRPFQGWRYLEAKDAPPDMGQWSATSDESLSLRDELIAHGLL